MKNVFGRAVIIFAVLNLILQLSVGYYAAQKLNTAFTVNHFAVAFVFEILAFMILTPFVRRFYGSQKIYFKGLTANKLVFMSEGFSRLVPLGDYFAQRHYLARKKLPQGLVLNYIIVLYSFAIISLVIMFLLCQIYITFFTPNGVTEEFIGKFALLPFVFSGFFVLLFIFRKNNTLRTKTQQFFNKYFKHQVESPFKIVRNLELTKLQTFQLVAPLAITWVLEGVAFAFCIYAFGINPPLVLALYVYFFVKLFRFIPIFPGGVGEIEAVSTTLFLAYGYPAVPVLAGAVLFKLLSYWLPIAIGAISYRSLMNETVPQHV